MIPGIILLLFSLGSLLYGISRLAGRLSDFLSARGRLGAKPKKASLLWRHLVFPGSHRFSAPQRRFIDILIVSFMFYIFLLFLSMYLLETLRFSAKIGLNLTLFEIFLIVALLAAVFRHMIGIVVGKRKETGVIAASQYFVFFAALPYLLFYYSNDLWTGFIELGGNFGRLIFYFAIIMPELFCFVGFSFLRKKRRLVGAAFIIFALLISFELIPLKRRFLFYDPFSSESYGLELVPSTKTTRELEFQRSVKTIRELAEKSKQFPKERLSKITIYVPYANHEKGVVKGAIAEEMRFPNYVREIYFIKNDLDSDKDGLSDFQEAELLCDAYERDTDGDGVTDGKDTDPLNEYVDSDYGKIKTAILTWLNDTFALYLVGNEFHKGRGEFENTNKKVIILSWDDIDKWNIIFGEQYTFNGQRSLFGQCMFFCWLKFDIFRKIAIMEIERKHGVWSDASGFVVLLIKFRNNWRVIGARCLYI